MDQLSFVFDSLKTAFNVLGIYWWIYLPPLLFLTLYEGFQTYTRLKYLSSLKWILLELRLPKEIRKSPKATEQVFAALHGVHIPIRRYDKFFKGKVMDWFSMEVVGWQGEIHFYIRTQEQYKPLVQSQIYAQYPDAEVFEVEDYVNRLPSPIPSDKYDLWGSEMILAKEDAYPIRTYLEFEEPGVGREDVKRVDPIASLAEALASLEANEYIVVQLLVRPTGDDWVKKGQAVVDKLMGKETKVKYDFLSKAFFAIDELILGGAAPSEKKEEKESITPGKRDILKAVESKFYKLGFESGIRFMYAAAKETLHRVHVAAIIGAYKQFASQTSNGFRLNLATATMGKWPFKAQKEYSRKVSLVRKLKNRSFVLKPFILNIEELATIYHFPDFGVKAPLLPRIEAKKGEPPAELPTA